MGAVDLQNLDGTNYAAWASLGVFDTLEGTAIGYMVARRVDRTACIVWKLSPGPIYDTNWYEGRLNEGEHNGKFELVREGNTIKSYYVDPSSNTLMLYDEMTIEMNDPGVCWITRRFVGRGEILFGLV